MNIFKSNKSSEKEVSLSLDDEDAKDFMEYLKEAQETDLREIERTGCVSQGRDMRNGNVIVMIPNLGLNRMERPEQMFRKMLLLFLLKTHEMVGTAYSVVYAHTAIDIINQYPLIYKFYSILPRFYKKNLQKMYIIHPNIGIRAFFEFARIFLSHKFYNKLCLLESILDFQRIIFPTQLPLPLKFLRKEDEDREVKYFGPLPSVRQSYINSLGTMEILWICAEFMRQNKGFQSPGIFRVPGDDGEVSLAKLRLQYGYNVTDPQNGWISLSENKKYIVVGNINDLYADNPNGGSSGNSSSSSSSSAAASEAASQQIRRSHSSGTASGSSSAHTSLNQPIRLSPPKGGAVPATSATEAVTNVAAAIEENGVPTCSIVILNSNYTVAEIFKLSIRELVEPLVPEDITQDLLTLTRVYGSRPLDLLWEKAVAQRLADLPLSNLSTLIFIVRFLRDVGKESAVNNMDTKNLSLVFAPTIFRFEMTDLIAATMDIKLVQSVMREVIERPTLLQYTVRFFREMYARRREQSSPTGHNNGRDDDDDNMDVNEMEQLMHVNPFMLSTEMVLTLPELSVPGIDGDGKLATTPTTEDLISSGLSPAMVARMNRSANARRTTTMDEDDDVDRNSKVMGVRLHDDNDHEEDGNDSEQSSGKKTSDVGAQGDEDAFNASVNNRYFAMGRQTRVGGSGATTGTAATTERNDNESNHSKNRNVMSDRDLSDEVMDSVHPMRGRSVPPVPPPRQLPAFPPSASGGGGGHAVVQQQPPRMDQQPQSAEASRRNSAQQAETTSRTAVVLNGQIDREALALLDDLQLSDASSTFR